MHSIFRGGALALAALIPVSGASAQDEPETDNAITVDAPLLHPSAGMMNDHMHDGGTFMVGLRFERSRSSGANRSGTDEIGDPAIVAAGFTSRTRSMEMDMVMLDLMYAPSDKLTFMVMPMYMWHRMEMIGIDPAATGGGHSGHGGHMAIPFGETHEHATDGFGDTLVSASYRVARSASFGAHATLGVWVPTGAVDRTNPDGSFVHYGMQPGAGTWDLEPSLTLKGRAGAFGWGAQGAYRWKIEDENESGFRFGDVFRLTGWTSYLLTPSVGATARVEYRQEGAVEGHYNAGHNHAAPPDRQANYGGKNVTAALGLNWLLPVAGPKPPQLGIEFAVPLHQDLNGIQAPQDWRFAMSISKDL